MLRQTEDELIFGLTEGSKHGGVTLEASLFPAGCADSLVCNGIKTVRVWLHVNKRSVELKTLALMVGMVRRTGRRQCSLLPSSALSIRAHVI